MRIPILNGIFADGSSDFRSSYPRNLIPVPKQVGISEGYLRPAYGISQFGTGPGHDRGAINWDNQCYRVMGTKLCRVESDGSVSVLGDVGGSGQVTLDYSFDRLAIASSGMLFFWDGISITQVTDPDLGVVNDFLWIDGYFLSTDGESLVVTELNDPTAVNPLKYGSAEANPDPVVSLVKLRNEAYAIGRYTIEVFQNAGGAGFPFARIDGAQMQRGAVGTFAASVFMEAIAFVGGGVNEPPAVWLGGGGQTQKISTREIEQVLATYSSSQLAQIVVESMSYAGHQFLYVHLPDCTWVYDGAGTLAAEEPVWFQLTSSIVGKSKYRARNFVWCYDKWLVGDPTTFKHGYMTGDVASHYGDVIGWEFATSIVYNEGRGAIFHELELVSLTGNVTLGEDPTIWASYSLDGQTWSQERPRSAGKIGERQKRIVWLRQGNMRSFRMQKFRGTSDAHMSIARLEARVEPLNV